ncbi:hypothetical protein K7X08_004256 [Anisodus acutangulus]|uniref:Uncharacterized protein n=1 Tax=Anisodus acutangulus TaxID=402998 RepID=A0A9Q1MH89_9SOLA|nr:hypothetical protein K7X08_004256 [Anisodus acutangulus]
MKSWELEVPLPPPSLFPPDLKVEEDLGLYDNGFSPIDNHRSLLGLVVPSLSKIGTGVGCGLVVWQRPEGVGKFEVVFDIVIPLLGLTTSLVGEEGGDGSICLEELRRVWTL